MATTAIEITQVGRNSRSTYYRYGGSDITVAHTTHGTFVCLTCGKADSCPHSNAVAAHIKRQVRKS